ncbi:MAG TPA: hypothetical protein VKY59_01240, partial [Spirillospora sp.]|nr:hypothetical protein [Spirillospora sp.]
MDEQTTQQLQQLLTALRALQQSVEKAVQNRTYSGTGQMALKSYRNLHSRIAQALPDDFYITEVLALDIADDADEAQIVAQVNMAAGQLVTYLEQQLRQETRRPQGFHFDVEDESFDFQEMGRALRDRILAQTKDTIRKAMAGIDIDIDLEGSSRGRKRKIKITSDGDWVTLDNGDLIGVDLSGQDLSSENL